MPARDTPSALMNFADAYGGLPDWFHAPAIVIMLFAATFLVVMVGGPPSAMVQLFFAPILLAAFRYHFRGGLICGAVAGFLAGPIAYLIPLGRAPVIISAFITLHWALRIAWMSIIGGAMGAALSYARSRAEALSFHLSTDAATRLPNLEAARRYANELAQRETRGGNVTKVAIRVTNFQSLINAFGHGFADEAMCQVANQLRVEIPRESYLARVGRGTFAVLTAGTQEEHAPANATLLSRIQRAPIVVEGIAVYLDFAMGLASVGARHFDVDRLFADAETTVTEADASGMSFALHDPLTSGRQQDRVSLLGEIDSAMRSGQLMLAFQPRLDLHRNMVSGVEALARWKHPGRGWIPPSEFVPLVEQTRFIDTFTQWVLHRGVRQLAEWRGRGHTVSMSVNISANNLTDDWLLDHVDGLLREFEIPASALELEITESAFMEVTDKKLDLLHKLAESGLRIAIDDFGTGYASLAYLRQLPVDLLKLDRTFIENDLHETQNHLMVGRIVQMAKDRNLRVVAEGVETAEALQAVRRLDCDEAQGYLIAKPMFAAEVEKMFGKVWESKVG